MRKVVSSALLLALVGCGGSNESQDSLPDVDITPKADVSEISFFISSSSQNKGVLNVTNLTTNTVEKVSVDNLNTFKMELPDQTSYLFEFVPDSAVITCPSINGCGRSIRNDPNDLNDNNEIDFEEPINASLTHKVSAHLAAGRNTLYFSPFSTLMAERNEANNLLTATSTPLYHLTHSNLSQSLANEYVAQAFNYSDILNQHSLSQEGSGFAAAYDEASQDVSNDKWQAYNEVAKTFLKEVLLNEKLSALYAPQSSLVNARLNSAFDTKALPMSSIFSNDPKNALLVQLRDALAVLRLQDEKYSDELDTRLKELESVVNDSAERAIELLGESITEVVLEVSPIDDSPSGLYVVNGLDVEYNDSPFTWKVNGILEGHTIEINVVMPTWRKSATLGDQIEGSGVAQISKGDLSLEIEFEKIKFNVDGTLSTDDNSNTTGRGEFLGKLKLVQAGSELTGSIDTDIHRKLTEGSLETIIPELIIDGSLATANQNMKVKVYANEATPFVRDANSIAFGFELMPDLKGSNDLRLLIIGDSEQLSNLNQGDVFVVNNGKALEILLRTSGDNVNLVARGEFGYWLDLKKKGRNYTGGYYYGDNQVGDIQTIRGIPGVLFPDGTFESLF